MAFSVVELALLAFLLVGPVLTLVALVDLARRPAPVWAAAGQNQLVWALIVLLAAVIGPILYLVVARPALVAASGPGPSDDGLRFS